jgi:hypothetical protein
VNGVQPDCVIRDLCSNAYGKMRIMKTVIVYRPNSEHGRKVEEFVHEYTRRYPAHRLEVMNIDSRDGSAIASLYDITSYPAILALNDDGSASMVWQDEMLPLLDDVAGYTHES